MRKFLIMAAGTALSLSVASNALAVDCDPAAVYIHGSSASQPIIQALGPVAAALTPPVKIVYDSTGSSGAGIVDIINPPGTANGVAPAGGTDYTTSTGVSCLYVAGTIPTDVIGVSDVYASSLAGAAITGGATGYTIVPDPATLPADVVDTLGPVQAFTISVHDDPSFPVAISAAAAFNVFGVTSKTTGDATYAVAPWTVIGEIFLRGQGSGTWQTWARNLGLNPAKVASTTAAKSGDVLSGLQANSDAAAIGIVALNDLVAAKIKSPSTTQIRPLAFKAKGQDFAYYTSGTATGTDMINVRDGHYQTWANLHFLAHKATAGDFSPNVKKVLGLLESQAAIQAMAGVRAVPTCAMQVSRSSDGGDFTAFKPTKPCGCFFEASASGAAPTSSTCKACTADADCGASGQCDFGYCEAK